MSKDFITYFLLVFFLVSGAKNLHSQTEDTVKKINKTTKKEIYGNARKATIMSAVIPGLGQIYNKKYWKAPIVYAGLAGFGYLLIKNQDSLNKYTVALRNAASTNTVTQALNKTGYNTDQLYTLKIQYRKYRDIGIIGCAIFYLVNIIDANVDAHLKTFDVSDNLSMRIKPFNNLTGNYSAGFGLQSGVCIQLNFKQTIKKPFNTD